LFDLAINKQNNAINVTREFDAPLNLVWDAWTKAEIIDQWWAPVGAGIHYPGNSCTVKLTIYCQ